MLVLNTLETFLANINAFYSSIHKTKTKTRKWKIAASIASKLIWELRNFAVTTVSKDA